MARRRGFGGGSPAMEDNIAPFPAPAPQEREAQEAITNEQFQAFIEQSKEHLDVLFKKKGFNASLVELAARADLDTKDNEHNKEALLKAIERAKKTAPAKVREALEAAAIAQGISLDTLFLEMARRQNSLSRTLSEDLPQRPEGGIDGFAQYLDRVLARPDSGFGTENPFAAGLMARFQEIATPAKVPLYPKGSPISSQFERVGGRLAGEATLSYMELSIFSVTITKTAAAFGVALSGPAAIALAVVACTTIIFPGRNELFKSIIETDGNVVAGLKRFVKRKPKFAATALALIGGVALGGVGYSIDRSIEDGAKSGAAAEQLGQAVEGTGAPGESIIERMQTSDTMPALVQRLPRIVDALLRAEQFPDQRAQIQEEFGDVLSPGGTGNEGTGPVYAARCYLFGRPIPPTAALNPEHRRLIDQARAEAGFNQGETIEAFVGRQYQDYIRDTAEAKARATELARQISENRETLSDQTFTSIFVGSVFHFEGSMSQEEALAPRAELEQHLRTIEARYNAMRQNVENANRILSSASEQIAPGTGLTLRLPPFTLNEVFAPLFGVTPNESHPIAEQWAEQIASAAGGEPEQYYSVARNLIRGTSGLAALILALGMIPLFYTGALRRNRKLKEREVHHIAEAREAENEYVDQLVEQCNFIRPYIPGNPEVTPFRARFALRQLVMSKSPVILGEDANRITRFKHWFVSNYLERGKVTDDTEALKDYAKVLRALQTDAKLSEELLETLYPGFTALTTALGNDQAVLLKLSAGGKMTAEEAGRLKQMAESPWQFADKVNRAQLECAYATAQAEFHTLESEYTCLSHILEDVMTGANKYEIFNPFTNEEDLHLETRNMAEAINTYEYLYTQDGRRPQLSEEHQRVMRRIAAETQAAKVIMMIMAENRNKVDSLKEEIGKVERAFITRQLKDINKDGFKFSIPKSMVDGDDPETRELLTASAGAFQDVAKDVKLRLGGLTGLANEGRGADESVAEIIETLTNARGGIDDASILHVKELLEEIKQKGKEEKNEKITVEKVSVQEQLDAMAQRLFEPRVLQALLADLNYGRHPDEQLNVELQPVYDIKGQQLPASDTRIDIPGCILRFRVLDSGNREVVRNDFQMSHVLLEGRKPKFAADKFGIWLNGAIRNAKLESRKQWLEQFVSGDENKNREGTLILDTFGNQDKSNVWLDTFYHATVLKWRRAETARALQGATRPIKPEALDIFDEKYDREGISYDATARPETMREIIELHHRLPLWNRSRVSINLATQQVTRSNGKPKELTVAQYVAELRKKTA